MKLGTPANGTRAAYCNNWDSARPAGSLRQMLHQLCDQAEGPRRRFFCGARVSSWPKATDSAAQRNVRFRGEADSKASSVAAKGDGFRYAQPILRADNDQDLDSSSCKICWQRLNRKK